MAAHHGDLELHTVPDQDRGHYPVGRLLRTGLGDNTSLGDDMRTEGTLCTRIGALQANGEGGSLESLVHTWSHTVTSLRLDISCISETGISPGWKHKCIEALFLRKGYTVISHNKDSEDLISTPLQIPQA